MLVNSLVWILAAFIVTGCSDKRRDLVEFNSEDKSYSIGLYKDTAMMIVDDEDHLHRLGIKGFGARQGSCRLIHAANC